MSGRVPTSEEARRALRELRLRAMKDWMNPDLAEKHCDRILAFVDAHEAPVPEDVKRAMDRIRDQIEGVVHAETRLKLLNSYATILNALCAALQRAETAEAELDRLFTAAVRLVGFTRNNEYPERLSPEADELTRLIDNLDTVARRLAARRGAASKEGENDA